ncbi:MAG: hypothetical protein KDJ35_09570 [Alphaproteobacteria bacterium]|nr:hypothetical protein [Alphaproteobacteria bacterium]
MKMQTKRTFGGGKIRFYAEESVEEAYEKEIAKLAGDLKSRAGKKSKNTLKVEGLLYEGKPSFFYVLGLVGEFMSQNPSAIKRGNEVDVARIVCKKSAQELKL